MLYIMASVSLAGLLGLIALLRVHFFPHTPTIESDRPLMVGNARKRSAPLMVCGAPLQASPLGSTVGALPLQLQRSTVRPQCGPLMVSNASAYRGARGPPW